MSGFEIRPVRNEDLENLNQLEVTCFDSDRLSRRRLKHWVQATNRVLLVAEEEGELVGYGLVLLHRGTRLARLYSLAVDPKQQGKGLGRKLLQALENASADTGRLFMRLEVAKNNESAIQLYQSMGYVVFGIYHDYYDDHQDALRMQKRIRYQPKNLQSPRLPWYQQTTEFTCGPAAAMMAMAGLDASCLPNQQLELDLWREATTIFMTSGHGGTHPVGLALALQRRGFRCEVFVNQANPLFLESVRSQKKREVLTLVDAQFREKAKQRDIPVHHRDFWQTDLERWLAEGAMAIMLISTYRLDGKKAPHWVTLSGMDEHCLYVHDPGPIKDEIKALDCQYLPIARDDFARMSMFGRERLRTAVVIRNSL